ncbi:hypothetical protein Tco_0144536 [Tanacetum coccineum]
MDALKFVSSHNMVAFLDKPTESDGFEQIVDFLNAHPIKYALTVNSTIYTSYIEQFWTTAKVKIVNREGQIQALMDKNKVIITKTSIRSDLQLEDAKGTECLPNSTIFEQLALMSAKTTAWNEFSSTMASAVICLATNQKFNFSKYIFDNMGKDFSGRDTPLFPTMIVQEQEQVGEGSEISTDSYHTPTTTQPSTSKPHKKHSRRKQRKDTEDPQLSGPTEPVIDDTKNVASVPTHFNDPLLSGEDRLKLNELMELCIGLSQRVLHLEKIKTSQAAEITELKERVKKLEKKGGSRTHRLKRLYKVGRSARVVSSEDEGLEVTLVDETQGRYGDNLMFDTGVLDNEQDMAEKEADMAEKDVSTANPVATVGEVVTTANVVILIEIKAAKPNDVTTAATTTTTAVTRPKVRGVVVQEPSEFTTTTSPSQPSQLPQAKDKGKTKMVEPKKPLKKKDQIMFDKEVAQKLQAQLDVELEEEEKLARQREEDANIAE